MDQRTPRRTKVVRETEFDARKILTAASPASRHGPISTLPLAKLAESPSSEPAHQASAAEPPPQEQPLSQRRRMPTPRLHLPPCRTQPFAGPGFSLQASSGNPSPPSIHRHAAPFAHKSCPAIRSPPPPPPCARSDYARPSDRHHKSDDAHPPSSSPNPMGR